jgi:DNA-binding IclR family transcriptional regulator
MSSEKGSSTLAHAIQILDHLADAGGFVPLGRIAVAVGLAPSIVHRLLVTLRAHGLVVQDPRTRRYALGLRLFMYANRVVATAPFGAAIEPILRRLRDLTGETATLHLPRGSVRVCVLEAESQQEIRRSVGVGRQVPLYAGASGRAILAFLPDEEQRRLLADLPPARRAEVEALLEQTRRDRFAISHAESTPNVAALAAPLFDRNSGRVLGSISLSGPLFRWDDQAMAPYVEPLLAAAREIEETLAPPTPSAGRSMD